MRTAAISRLAFVLPESLVRNEELASLSDRWSADSILEKTGIAKRHIAAQNETAGDLACQAGGALLHNTGQDPSSIDLLVFCTQSPDYALPTTACILQHKLGLRTDCAAFDFNLGCSGYVYGLSIVKSMIESGEASRALLLTGETYSKWMANSDLGVRAIFGDAGTATLIETVDQNRALIGPFVYGTDGTGKDNLIVHGSGHRQIETHTGSQESAKDWESGALFMDGPQIFAFTANTIPKAVQTLLTKADLTWDDIDWVVFHQANKFMLNHLQRKCRIPEEKFVYCLRDFGNTVSNTIPIALAELANTDKLVSGQRVMLVGFGVGYSWSACIVNWAA